MGNEPDWTARDQRGRETTQGYRGQYQGNICPLACLELGEGKGRRVFGDRQRGYLITSAFLAIDRLFSLVELRDVELGQVTNV